MRQKAEYKKDNAFNSYENPLKKILPDLIQMYKSRIKKNIFTKVWVLPRFYTSEKVLFTF